jgi:hypothetical protein
MIVRLNANSEMSSPPRRGLPPPLPPGGRRLICPVSFQHPTPHAHPQTFGQSPIPSPRGPSRQCQDPEPANPTVPNHPYDADTEPLPNAPKRILGKLGPLAQPGRPSLASRFATPTVIATFGDSEPDVSEMQVNGRETQDGRLIGRDDSGSTTAMAS